MEEYTAEPAHTTTGPPHVTAESAHNTAGSAPITAAAGSIPESVHLWGPGTLQLIANLELAEAAHERALGSGSLYQTIAADANVCQHIAELLKEDHPGASAFQGTEVNRLRNELMLQAMRRLFEFRELRLRNALMVLSAEPARPPPAESPPQPDTADESTPIEAEDEY